MFVTNNAPNRYRLSFVNPKRIIAALVVAVLVTSLSAPTGIAAPVQAAVVEAGSVLDSSGLRIVDDITQARPTNEAQAQALSDAFDLAEANPR